MRFYNNYGEKSTFVKFFKFCVNYKNIYFASSSRQFISIK